MFENEFRSDAEIQEGTKKLFVGVTPERKDELESFWDDYQLEVRLYSDDCGLLMEGGAYRYIRFNHRMLRATWVAAHAAWEAYRWAEEEIYGANGASTSRIEELLNLTIRIRDAPDAEAEPLLGVPEPGCFPTDVERGGPAQIAGFAAGWAMLHEMKHVMIQQDGESSPDPSDREARRAEEFICDAFAATFIVEKAGEYVAETGDCYSSVRKKREAGVYFGLIAILILSYPSWGETDNHPEQLARIDAVRKIFSPNDTNDALLMCATALKGIQQIWPDAPAFELLTEVADD